MTSIIRHELNDSPAAAVRSVPRPAADHVEVGDEVAGAVDHVLAAGRGG